MVHCSPATGARRPRPISGNAMFTTVVSMAIRNMLTQHVPTITAPAARPGGRALVAHALIAAARDSHGSPNGRLLTTGTRLRRGCWVNVEGTLNRPARDLCWR